MNRRFNKQPSRTGSGAQPGPQDSSSSSRTSRPDQSRNRPSINTSEPVAGPSHRAPVPERSSDYSSSESSPEQRTSRRSRSSGRAVYDEAPNGARVSRMRKQKISEPKTSTTDGQSQTGFAARVSPVG
ncbi:uncharacterized protein LOC129750551 [Uranotaenia lowii]|uniref:uncharacterized protein LOC129750551 n=1 Tax=Uranotaenia lowii TaxID=190385 RepID=UPI002479D8E4|nr:uncharacterized protein LOC129750551 [Uranotaenia lowii]